MKKKEFKQYKKIIEQSKLFSSAYYLKLYHDARISNEIPIDHFIKVGLKEDRKPNKNFDPVWYREFYPDIKKSKIYPFIHFLKYGQKENRFMNDQEYQTYQELRDKGFDVEFYKNEHEDLKGQKEGFDFLLHYVRYGKNEVRNIRFLRNENPKRGCLFGPIVHNPLVSVIAVNYNGANDLPDFLDTLSNQSYKNFELLIVDNNSSDESEEIVKEKKSQFKSLQFLHSGVNLGFAEGNNFALPYAHGELIALINVDTKLDIDWLKELVDAMSQDATVAAVASKTLFFERFQDLKLTYKKAFSLDLDTLVDSLEYKKYFIRHGEIRDNKIYSEENTIIISLPVQSNKMQLTVNVELLDAYLCVKKGNQRDELFHIEREKTDIVLDFSQESVINSSFIINNAGSITIDGMPGDRGIGEYDIGQYDSKCYVDFVCGVSVLLRRSAIVNREIFVPEFFAYYEDSELSRWLREEGHNILYAPRSILYHQHSATSSEGSPLWSLLVTRSREIYQHNYINVQDASTLINTINHYEEYFKNKVPVALYIQLKQFTKSLAQRLEIKNDIVKPRKAIAIYNTYWNTKGGGESHALAFATILQKDAPVYLVSENDFDIEELSEYYHLDLSNCYKLVETQVTPEFTQKFDVFINSTYRSNLVSLAKDSYYIVSFPHEEITQEVLASYTFLYNSDYTKKWAEKYWGNTHRSDIVYPIGMIDIPDNEMVEEKEKIIISVGRFFVGAHSKNQHIVAEAFKQVVEKNPSFKEWKLVLMGSLNKNNEEDVKYVKEIQKLLHGTNAEVIINAPREQLQMYYKKAFTYIHASGYGQDAEKYPEKFEHFGITPVEAMVNGCYPIVYEVGGPAELIHKLGIGETFGSINELSLTLNKVLIDKKKCDIRDKIFMFLEVNNFEKKVRKIILKAR